MNSKERREIRYQNRQRKKHKDEPELSDILSFTNLFETYDRMSKGSRKSKGSYARFEEKSLYAIYEISDNAEHGEIYKSKGVYDVDITDRGKKRHIQTPHLEERLVQKTINDYYLSGAVLGSIVDGNVGNVKNKGMVQAYINIKEDLVKAFNKWGTSCCIAVIDYSSYFNSIIPDKALNVVSKNTKNNLIKKQLAEFCQYEQMPFGAPFSQLVGVVYPNVIDHFIKEKCHVKFFGRYVDDAYLIMRTREELMKVLDGVSELGAELGLTLNENKVKISTIEEFKYLKIEFRVKKSGKIISSIPKKKMQSNKKKLKKLCNKWKSGEIELNKIREYCKSVMDTIESFGSRQNEVEFVNYIKSLFGGKINVL